MDVEPCADWARSTTECQQGDRLMSKVLSIENLHVAIGGKEILRGRGPDAPPG